MPRVMLQIIQLISQLSERKPGPNQEIENTEISIDILTEKNEDREFVLVGKQAGKSNLDSERRFGPFGTVEKTIRATAELEDPDEDLWVEVRDPERDCAVSRLPYIQWVGFRLMQ